MFYQKELETLKKKGLFRERKVSQPHRTDLASNDYLGLSQNWEVFQKSVRDLEEFGERSPKASMLVNGYSEIHQKFETRISKLNGFENGIVFGSGFLANFGILEALGRNGDEVFLDSEYHASGVVATKLINRTKFFNHNSAEHLETLLKSSNGKRKIVAVEGIYSMSGDILNKDIFEVADKFDAILLVDEAHSFGTIGQNLLGVFDHFNITPKENHIKLGTLGKAIGSYGAYVLASNEIISFLENRAKPIIYSTAPSLFETAVSLNSIEYIWQNKVHFLNEIVKRKNFFLKNFKIDKISLIYPLPMRSSSEAIEQRDKLLELGFVVGAIRPPTVQKPILRVIPNLAVSISELERFRDSLNLR
jgi:8-amino-7-oxononanoate synthase